MKRLPLTISIILLLCFYANAQSAVDRGLTTEDGIYINPGFGFSYKYPKGWVVHGEATNERIRELGRQRAEESGKLSKEGAEVAINNTYQLLTLFRYAVGTPGIAFNPAILVMAENVAYAPGIKNGKDYLFNVRVLMRKGGSPALLKDPTEYRFAESQFFRDDYAVEVNGVHTVQAYFATIAQGYAVVFVFIGEDQKSVDEMAKSMETFNSIPAVRRGVTTISGSPPPRKPN
jgi:hypothetical protein